MMKRWNIKQIMFHTTPGRETQVFLAGEGVKARKRKGLRRNAGRGNQSKV